MKKSIFKNVIYKAMLNIFNIIIPIIVGPYVLRIMEPELMGRITYSESIYVYFLTFAAFGIFPYGLREISRIRENKQEVSKLFTSLFSISLISNAIISTLYFLFIFYKFNDTPQFPVLLIYGINMILNIFYIEWVNEALENFDFIALKTMLVRLVNVILIFTLVKSKEDFIPYVLINTLFFNGANYIISFIYAKRKYAFNFKSIEIRKHLKPLIIVLLITNANILYSQLDKIMLGAYVSEEAVSYYSLGQMIMTIINALLLSIIYVTIPRLSNVLSTESENSYTQLLDKICSNYFAFLFPASVGIFAFSEEIILLYGGDKFAAAIPVLKIFSVYMITLGIESIFTNQVIYVKRREKSIILFILGCGILNLIMKGILAANRILTPSTAVATTIIASLCYIILEYIFIRKKLKVNINILTFNKIKYLIISLIFIPVTYLIKSFVSNIIIISLLGVGINVIIYVAILLLIKDEVIIWLFTKLKLIK